MDGPRTPPPDRSGGQVDQLGRLLAEPELGVDRAGGETKRLDRLPEPAPDCAGLRRRKSAGEGVDGLLEKGPIQRLGLVVDREREQPAIA